MKAATVSELKKELKHRSPEELLEITLRLSKFKKENKELLTYLLFEASNEELYIDKVKTEVDTAFQEINTSSIYFIKKAVRKILRELKKKIRYSGKAQTEVELLLYFCTKLKGLTPHFNRSSILQGIKDTQLNMANKKLNKLHEDLQYDYSSIIESLG